MLNNNLENEMHADKLKVLGDQTLNAKFELNLGEQGDVIVKVNNIRDFINLICKPGGLEELRQNSQFFYKARFWSQSDEIISKFIDYIECLESEDIMDMKYYNPDDPYGLRGNDAQQINGKVLLPELNHNFETESEPDAESKLLIKKAYMILSLFKFGFCPFQIMNCLKSKANDQNFNWEKIVDVIIHFERSQTKSEKKFFSSSYCHDRNHKAVHLIKFMSLVQPLLDNDANLEQQHFSEVDVADIFNFGFSVYDFLFFALSYAKYTVNKPEEEFLSNYAKENWMSEYSADKDKDDLANSYNNDVLFFLQDEHRFSRSLWKNNKLEEDFYTLAQNMDPVVFCVFVAMMMQHVSFTKKQMEFIENKVNNGAMFALLKRLNTNLNYKTIYDKFGSLWDDSCERYVKFSAGSSYLDQVLRKIFKGIGYILFGLLVVTIVILPQFVIGTIFYFGISMITTNWIIDIIYGICFGVVVLALLSRKKVNEHFVSLMLKIKSWYKSIPEAVTKFYDAKIGRLFNLYNLYFPTNNIGNPPALQNVSNPVVSVRPAERPNINESQIENPERTI